MKHKIAMELEKETKNTVRYAEVPESGRPPVIGTLYIQKWAVGNPAPAKITVEVEDSA